MQERIKLFLADNQPNYRAWMQSAIAINLPRFKLIGQGDTFSEIIDAFNRELPNILILDFPTGSNKIANAIKRHFPQIRIFLLCESNAILRPWHASRQRCIDKLSDVSTLSEMDRLTRIMCDLTVLMIHEIGKGITTDKNGLSEFEFSLDTNSFPRNCNKKPGEKQVAGPVQTVLTNREIDVVKLICKEYSNQEIAQKLYIAVSTVETHRENILKKIKGKNMASIIKYAFNNNLYP